MTPVMASAVRPSKRAETIIPEKAPVSIMRRLRTAAATPATSGSGWSAPWVAFGVMRP